MTDKAAISTDFNDVMFDDNVFDILPLITKERTQKFELLLHLIPNLKQHIIVCGAPGIGKTLLLDMLYDIDSDAWQCCFVQGSAELSFEMIEAQLTKSMLRNKHESLARAFQDTQDKHKKIVLIIDDAGLLVSGLVTTLVEYATTHTVLKLILSFTPETRQKYRKTDRVLDQFYLIDIPRLNQEQTAYFLRHLATKPRTYGNVEKIDDKLLSKIYQETQGIPARLISDFTKLSRDTQNDHTKWGAIFAGLLVLAIGINQGIHYVKQSPEKTTTSSNGEENKEAHQKDDAQLDANTTDTPENNIAPTEEKNTLASDEASADKTPPTMASSAENTHELPVEKQAESTANTTETANHTDDTPANAQAEQTAAPVDQKPDNVINNVSPTPQVANNNAKSPVVESTQAPTPPVIAPTTAPAISVPKAAAAPVIAFPKVEPAKGTKIQALPDKIPVTSIALTAPHVETSPSEQNDIDTSKIESKIVEKLSEVKVDGKKEDKDKDKDKDKKEDKKAEDKKVKSVKQDTVRKTPSPKPVVETSAPSNETPATPPPAAVATIATPSAPTQPSTPVLGHYTLQLITLSSDAAIAEFLKKHPSLIASHHVMKYEKNGQTRFSLMYGNFANAQEALAARGNLPTEFALALPRKFNAAP